MRADPSEGRDTSGSRSHPRGRRRSDHLASALAVLLVAAPLAAPAAEPSVRPSVDLDPAAAGPAAAGAPAALPNGACLSEAVAAQPGAASYAGRVAVTSAPGGGLGSIQLLDPATPEQAAALQVAFGTCPWPAAPAGGRSLQVRIRPPPDAPSHRAPPTELTPGPPPPPVSLDGKSLKLGTEKAAGFRRPTLVDEGCLHLKLRGKPRLAGLENKVKFAVLRDGSVTQLTFLSPVDPEVESLVEEAFSACRWIPAADPQGVPLAVWVILPLRIGTFPETGEAR